MYTLFHAMEEEVRDHLRFKSSAQKIMDGLKQKSSSVANKDVLSHWRLLSADADEEDAQMLLKW